MEGGKEGQRWEGGGGFQKREDAKTTCSSKPRSRSERRDNGEDLPGKRDLTVYPDDEHGGYRSIDQLAKFPPHNHDQRPNVLDDPKLLRDLNFRLGPAAASDLWRYVKPEGGPEIQREKEPSLGYRNPGAFDVE